MKDMRKIVCEGYENGEYARVFRVRKILTDFERRFFDSFLALLPGRPQIVDFGCGTGVPYDKYLVEHGSVLTGLDICRKHLSQAKKNIPEATFIEADFASWEPDQKFDALVSLFAIFHIPRREHEALLRRIAETINSNGVLLCTLAAQEVEQEEPDWLGAPMAWSSYAPDFYLSSLEKLGFNITKSDFEGRPGDEERHFWLIAQKRNAA
jgi:cyclopropane fatty-acyl-phospholipid synthase-like methyltransferase